jgi:DNA-binding FadR family transcriptional regulator
VVVQLEALIQQGDLKPGDPLPSERELMLSFGVGRPAIREALFALHRMGLVIVANGERPRVSSPTPERLVGELGGAARLLLAKPDGVRHFQHARTLFESALAEDAARVASAADVAALEQALAANAAALGDNLRFMKTDVAFHLAIATIPRNPIYLALHGAIVGWLEGQRSVALRRAGVDTLALHAHQRIFDAIRAHDPTAAGQAMRAHLDAIVECYWRITLADA